MVTLLPSPRNLLPTPAQSSTHPRSPPSPPSPPSLAAGSMADKPACGGDPTCTGTRCFEKPPGPPGPQIASVHPASIPVEAPVAVEVTAAPPSKFNPSAWCRIVDAAGCTRTFPAEVRNASSLLCRPPPASGSTAAIAGGAGTLSVANRLVPGVAGGGDFGNTLGLDAFHAVTVAIGRRPYITETTGHVLVLSAFPAALLPSGHAASTCTVEAVLGASGIVVSNVGVPRGDRPRPHRPPCRLTRIRPRDAAGDGARDAELDVPLRRPQQHLQALSRLPARPWREPRRSII